MILYNAQILVFCVMISLLSELQTCNFHKQSKLNVQLTAI